MGLKPISTAIKKPAASHANEPTARRIPLPVFFVICLVGFVIVFPLYWAERCYKFLKPRILWGVGQIGWLFGRPWFQSVEEENWLIRFSFVPPQDDLLIHFVTNQPNVVESSVSRTSEGICFRVVRCGYFLEVSNIPLDTLAFAVEHGYGCEPGVGVTFLPAVGR